MNLSGRRLAVEERHFVILGCRIPEENFLPEPLILCVDDEELGLRVRKLVLERAGYLVLTGIDGPIGLSIFASEPVSAVVLDYYMPGMNGGEVAAEMRRLRPEVPIILLSAYINLPLDVIQMVDCTILKGDGPEILLTKVREVLQQRTSGIDEEILG